MASDGSAGERRATAGSGVNPRAARARASMSAVWAPASEERRRGRRRARRGGTALGEHTGAAGVGDAGTCGRGGDDGTKIGQPTGVSSAPRAGH
jgi:hypothetical protein